MTNTYYHEFSEVNAFSLSGVKEESGKTVEAVLNIESCGVKHRVAFEVLRFLLCHQPQ
jgi:hypothetical protein